MNTGSTYYHRELNAHKGVGIDIDQTLINGPASHLLQNWVMEFYQEIDMHLITFRTGKWLEQLEQDVYVWGIKPEMFKGVHSVPLETAGPFWDMVNKIGDKRAPNFNRKKWERGLKHHKRTEEEYDYLELNLAMWKGSKCKELGLTALVDDLEHWVVPGCTTHGVIWINSLNLHLDHELNRPR